MKNDYHTMYCDEYSKWKAAQDTIYELETEVANLTTAATLANERVIELKAQLAYTKGLLEQTQADLWNSIRYLHNKLTRLSYEQCPCSSD